MADNTTPIAQVVRAGATRSPCIPETQLRQPCLVLRIRIRPRRDTGPRPTRRRWPTLRRETLRLYGYFLRLLTELNELYPLVSLLRLNSHEKSDVTADPPCWRPLTLAGARVSGIMQALMMRGVL